MVVGHSALSLWHSIDNIPAQRQRHIRFFLHQFNSGFQLTPWMHGNVHISEISIFAHIDVSSFSIEKENPKTKNYKNRLFLFPLSLSLIKFNTLMAGWMVMWWFDGMYQERGIGSCGTNYSIYSCCPHPEGENFFHRQSFFCRFAKMLYFVVLEAETTAHISLSLYDMWHWNVAKVNYSLMFLR